MDALSDRIVAWLVRVVATALIFAGAALIVAGGSTMPAASGALRDILVVVLEIAGAWVVLGLAAVYTLRRPATESPPGGWTLALALTLIAVAAWLVLRLRPFLSEWRTVASLLSSSDLWQTANSNMSGVVLVPLAGALAPPFIELAALAAFVALALLTILLTATKSRRFSQIYVACALVLTALVAGSLLGATAARLAADALQPWIEESKPRPEEYAQIRGVLDRYAAAVIPTATVLSWAWLGYAIWIPPAVLSARRR
ncbi:MAG TPA: hypothetical protein VGQ37_02885 [Vicinamibacterales bacterium]|nr:hypothetical protein [Vicinamibacterales bacterium]